MSATTLDEYTSVKATYGKKIPNHKQAVLAERQHILETVSRKTQDKTLTLKETTDLYAKFNRTYEAQYRSKTNLLDDESWALKLLAECEHDSIENNVLQTRINGIPEAAKPLQFVKPQQPTIKSPADDVNCAQEHTTKPINKPKIKLSEAFIYEQFSLDDHQTAYKNPNRTFWIFMGISALVTSSVLFAISQFL